MVVFAANQQQTINKLTREKKEASAVRVLLGDEHELLQAHLSVLQKEQSKATAMEEDVRAAVAEADKELEVANARLLELEPAISQITKPRLAEIRMYQRPPKPVMALANTICLMFRKPMEWSSARTLFADAEFVNNVLAYNKDSVSERLAMRLHEHVQSPDFSLEVMRNVSLACETLCAWVLAVDRYCQTRIRLKPQRLRAEKLRVRQREQQEVVARVEGEVAACKQKCGHVRKSLEHHETVIRQLEDKEAETLALLHHAKSLLTHLGRAQELWFTQLEKVDHKLRCLDADCLLAGLTQVCLPECPPEVRTAVFSRWVSDLTNSHWYANDEPTATRIEDILSTHDQQETWCRLGLPRDAYLMQGAAMAFSESSDVPLVYDPDGYFLSLMKAVSQFSSHALLSANHPEFQLRATQALLDGRTLIVVDVEVPLQPQVVAFVEHMAQVQAQQRRAAAAQLSTTITNTMTMASGSPSAKLRRDSRLHKGGVHSASSATRAGGGRGHKRKSKRRQRLRQAFAALGLEDLLDDGGADDDDGADDDGVGNDDDDDDGVGDDRGDSNNVGAGSGVQQAKADSPPATTITGEQTSTGADGSGSGGGGGGGGGAAGEVRTFLITRQALDQLQLGPRKLLRAIRFHATAATIEQKVLLAVLKNQGSALYAQEVSVRADMARLQRDMTETNDKMLQSIIDIDMATVLEDDDLVESLNQCHEHTHELQEAMNRCEMSERMLVKQRQAYQPLSQRGVLLYEWVVALQRIDDNYAWPLGSYLQLVREQLELDAEHRHQQQEHEAELKREQEAKEQLRREKEEEEQKRLQQQQQGVDEGWGSKDGRSSGRNGGALQQQSGESNDSTISSNGSGRGRGHGDRDRDGDDEEEEDNDDGDDDASSPKKKVLRKRRGQGKASRAATGNDADHDDDDDNDDGGEDDDEGDAAGGDDDNEKGAVAGAAKDGAGDGTKTGRSSPHKRENARSKSSGHTRAKSRGRSHQQQYHHEHVVPRVGPAIDVADHTDESTLTSLRTTSGSTLRSGRGSRTITSMGEQTMASVASVASVVSRTGGASRTSTAPGTATGTGTGMGLTGESRGAASATAGANGQSDAVQPLETRIASITKSVTGRIVNRVLRGVSGRHTASALFLLADFLCESTKAAASNAMLHDAIFGAALDACDVDLRSGRSVCLPFDAVKFWREHAEGGGGSGATRTQPSSPASKHRGGQSQQSPKEKTAARDTGAKTGGADVHAKDSNSGAFDGHGRDSIGSVSSVGGMTRGDSVMSLASIGSRHSRDNLFGAWLGPLPSWDDVLASPELDTVMEAVRAFGQARKHRSSEPNNPNSVGGSGSGSSGGMTPAQLRALRKDSILGKSPALARVAMEGQMMQQQQQQQQQPLPASASLSSFASLASPASATSLRRASMGVEARDAIARRLTRLPPTTRAILASLHAVLKSAHPAVVPRLVFWLVHSRHLHVAEHRGPQTGDAKDTKDTKDTNASTAGASGLHRGQSGRNSSPRRVLEIDPQTGRICGPLPLSVLKLLPFRVAVLVTAAVFDPALVPSHVAELVRSALAAKVSLRKLRANDTAGLIGKVYQERGCTRPLVLLEDDTETLPVAAWVINEAKQHASSRKVREIFTGAHDEEWVVSGVNGAAIRGSWIITHDAHRFPSLLGRLEELVRAWQAGDLPRSERPSATSRLWLICDSSFKLPSSLLSITTRVHMTSLPNFKYRVEALFLGACRDLIKLCLGEASGSGPTGARSLIGKRYGGGTITGRGQNRNRSRSRSVGPASNPGRDEMSQSQSPQRGGAAAPVRLALHRASGNGSGSGGGSFGAGSSSTGTGTGTTRLTASTGSGLSGTGMGFGGGASSSGLSLTATSLVTRLAMQMMDIQNMTTTQKQLLLRLLFGVSCLHARLELEQFARESVRASEARLAAGESGDAAAPLWNLPNFTHVRDFLVSVFLGNPSSHATAAVVVQDVLYRETAVRVDWDGLCKSLARSNRDAVSVFTDVDTVVIDPSAETREDYVGAISRLPQRVDASPLISVLDSGTDAPGSKDADGNSASAK